jgi:hypothetical protein
MKPPPDLLTDLQRQIVVPKARRPMAELPFWKRWIPALSFGLLVFGCIIALGVQTSELIQLQRENRTLREQSAQAGANPEVPTNASAEFGPSIQAAQEIERLRAEIQQLREQMQAAEQLLVEQAQLQDQLKAASARQLEEDPFAAHKARADSLACINNLKQIGLAARFWAKDHTEQLPPDLFSMRKELNTPKILVCPADTARSPAALSWEQWTPGQVTYEYLAAGTTEKDPYVVLARCPIHGHVGINDGSAHMNAKLVTEDSRLKLFRIKQ